MRMAAAQSQVANHKHNLQKYVLILCNTFSYKSRKKKTLGDVVAHFRITISLPLLLNIAIIVI